MDIVTIRQLFLFLFMLGMWYVRLYLPVRVCAPVHVQGCVNPVWKPKVYSRCLSQSLCSILFETLNLSH